MQMSLPNPDVTSKKNRARRRKKHGRWVRVESPIHVSSGEVPPEARRVTPGSSAQLGKLLSQRRSSNELLDRNIIQREFIRASFSAPAQLDHLQSTAWLSNVE